MMRFLLLSIVLLSGSAFAEDYYWTSNPNPGSGATRYPSLQSAASYQYDIYTVHHSNQKTRFESVMLGVDSARVDIFAIVKTRPGDEFVIYSREFYRHGDSCPEGLAYNPSTGGCEQGCDDTIGQQLAARGPDSPVTVDGDGYRTIIPEPFFGACFSGCYYEVQSSFSDRLSCALVSGSTESAFCNYRVTGNGENCGASTGLPAAGGDPLNPPPEPEPEPPTCPPGYAWTGNFCAELPDGGGDGPGEGGGDGPGEGEGEGEGGGGSGGGDGPGTGGGEGGEGEGGSGSGGDGGGDTGGGGEGEGEGEDDYPYDPSAEWSDGEANALGAGTGSTIGDMLSSGVGEALEQHQDEVGDALDEIPDRVSGMFDDLAGLSFMDNLFVPASGCSEVVIPLSLNGYDLSLSIDFCVLSKYKALIEWVIWCLTAIAIWNVYYSGLRLENAKASRGGH